MAKTVPLSKPLETHDGEVSELTLRGLTAADIVRMKKSPFDVIRLDGGEVELRVKYDMMMSYLAELSGLDEIVLGRMSGPDFQKACNVVGDIWNGLGE